MLSSLAITLVFGAEIRTVVWNDERSRLHLEVGASLRVLLPRPIQHLSASDPRVCEVTSESSTALVLFGKRPGRSTIVFSSAIGLRAIEAEVSDTVAPASSSDAGIPLLEWTGEMRLRVPLNQRFDVQGPAGLERVAPGSHRRCEISSIGRDQLRFRCSSEGLVTVFLWYANKRFRTLELLVGTDFGPLPDGG
jgi:hypothetical protein